MVDSFVGSLDITVMINILLWIIKIMHKQMLKTINLYWFHNDASERNNSLNGHSKKPWINEQRFVIASAK